MNLGDMFRSRLSKVSGTLAALSAALIPGAAVAFDAIVQPEETPVEAADAADAAAYVPYGPDMIKGQPEPGGWWFQDQYSDVGTDGLWMNNVVLTPVIVAICVMVLFLLLYVMARYNKRANPQPSRTSHNTLLEVLWTGLPILILVGIAIPSVNLLLKQYETPPADALTVKVTGYQWYWGYAYPDNGEFEVISNMMPDEEAVAKGFPAQLEVDNRMVVPVGVPIRVQVIGADVIHSFAIPSLWFKIDAVPGRLNEHLMQINEPGIYYGQCSELCGVRHGYMPIAIEAVPQERFEAWVLSHGGTLGDEEAAPVAEPAADTDAASPADAASEA